MPAADRKPPALPIHGANGWTPDDLRAALARGARCVRFEPVTSFVVATVRHQSRVHLTDDWQERYLWGFLYTMRSLALGPWGPLWCAWAAWVNVSGGVDATAEVEEWLDRQAAGDCDDSAG